MCVLKVSGMRNWLLYVEDKKTKAFDITGKEHLNDLREMCEANKIPVIGMVAFVHKKDATTYGDMLW